MELTGRHGREGEEGRGVVGSSCRLVAGKGG